MAVKQVRYVTDSEWEEMLKEQEQYMREMKKINDQYRFETRQKLAKKRKRNLKGQFIPKDV